MNMSNGNVVVLGHTLTVSNTVYMQYTVDTVANTVLRTPCILAGDGGVDDN